MSKTIHSGINKNPDLTNLNFSTKKKKALASHFNLLILLSLISLTLFSKLSAKGLSLM